MKLNKIERYDIKKKRVRRLEAKIRDKFALQRLKLSNGKPTNLKKGDRLEVKEGTAILVVEKNEILLYHDRPGTFEVVEGEQELYSARFKDIKRFAQNYTRYHITKYPKQRTFLLDLSPISLRFSCNVPVDTRVSGQDIQIRFYGFITFQMNNPFLYLSSFETIDPKCENLNAEDCFQIYQGEIVDSIIEWLQENSFSSLMEIKERSKEMFQFCKQRSFSNPSREKGVRFTGLTLTECLPTADSRDVLEEENTRNVISKDTEENAWDHLF